MKEQRGANDKETALFGSQLASIHLLQREHKVAHDLLNHAVPILQQDLGDHHPVVAYALADYGLACLHVGRLNVAKLHVVASTIAPDQEDSDSDSEELEDLDAYRSGLANARVGKLRR